MDATYNQSYITSEIVLTFHTNLSFSTAEEQALKHKRSLRGAHVTKRWFLSVTQKTCLMKHADDSIKV